MLFSDLRSPDVEQLAALVRRRIYRTFTPADDSRLLSNPITAQDFLLAALFVADPLNVGSLARMIRAASMGVQRAPTVVARTALSILENARFVSSTEAGYTITREGAERIKTRINNCGRASEVWGDLDSIRAKHLNRSLRGDKLTVA